MKKLLLSLLLFLSLMGCSSYKEASAQDEERGFEIHNATGATVEVFDKNGYVIPFNDHYQLQVTLKTIEDDYNISSSIAPDLVDSQMISNEMIAAIYNVQLLYVESTEKAGTVVPLSSLGEGVTANVTLTVPRVLENEPPIYFLVASNKNIVQKKDYENNNGQYYIPGLTALGEFIMVIDADIVDTQLKATGITLIVLASIFGATLLAGLALLIFARSYYVDNNHVYLAIRLTKKKAFLLKKGTLVDSDKLYNNKEDALNQNIEQ